jgi:hypothetical protein
MKRKNRYEEEEKEERIPFEYKYATLIKDHHKIKFVKFYKEQDMPKLELEASGYGIRVKKAWANLKPCDIILEIRHNGKMCVIQGYSKDDAMKIICEEHNKLRNDHYSWNSMVIARYTYPVCKTKTCSKPYYEFLNTGSHIVCTNCGLVWGVPNDGMARHLDCDGHEDYNKARCTLPHEQETDPNAANSYVNKRRKKNEYNIKYQEKSYRVRALKIQMKMVYDIANSMKMHDCDFIIHGAITLIKKYTIWLHKDRAYHSDSYRRQKHVGWMVCAAFIWLKVLLWEEQINIKSQWTLRVISAAAAECQKYDTYSNKNNRKSRPVSVETIWRYTVEITEECPEFSLNRINKHIPDIKSLEAMRIGTSSENVKRYTKCTGRKSESMILPHDKSWDMDLSMEDTCIIVRDVDLDGPAFKSGLNDGDIITTIGGFIIDNSYDIDKTIEAIVECKNKNKPIKITILR